MVPPKSGIYKSRWSIAIRSSALSHAHSQTRFPSPFFYTRLLSFHPHVKHELRSFLAPSHELYTNTSLVVIRLVLGKLLCCLRLLRIAPTPLPAVHVHYVLTSTIHDFTFHFSVLPLHTTLYACAIFSDLKACWNPLSVSLCYPRYVFEQGEDQLSKYSLNHYFIGSHNIPG